MFQAHDAYKMGNKIILNKPLKSFVLVTLFFKYILKSFSGMMPPVVDLCAGELPSKRFFKVFHP